MKTSYRYRRMINDRLSWEQRQQFLAELDERQSNIDWEPEDLREPSDYDRISQMVADEVEVYRAALAMLSTDMLAIYNFIDEWTERTNRSGKYARGQRIVVEHLSKIMAFPLHDGLVGGPFDPYADEMAERDRDLAQFEVPPSEVEYIAYLYESEM